MTSNIKPYKRLPCISWYPQEMRFRADNSCTSTRVNIGIFMCGESDDGPSIFKRERSACSFFFFFLLRGSSPSFLLDLLPAARLHVTKWLRELNEISRRSASGY